MYCSPVVGDLNKDGKGEIAIAYSNNVAVYDYNGNLLTVGLVNSLAPVMKFDRLQLQISTEMADAKSLW